MELILRNALPHRTRTTHAALHHLQQLIDIIGTTPLLMLDHVHTAIHLGFLDQLPVRPHALLAVCLGELVRDERRGVQARERDELPAVAELREPLDVGLLLGAGHGRFPVEGGGEVVCESGGGFPLVYKFCSGQGEGKEEKRRLTSAPGKQHEHP